MKATSTILSILTTAAIGAAVPFGVAENGLEDRQNSGCYPFEDPDCCVNYAVCQCANGKRIHHLCLARERNSGKMANLM